MLSKIQIEKISVTNTIAVSALSIALLASIFVNGDTVTITNIASGLIGYIGGRAANSVANNSAKDTK